MIEHIEKLDIDEVEEKIKALELAREHELLELQGISYLFDGEEYYVTYIESMLYHLDHQINGHDEDIFRELLLSYRRLMTIDREISKLKEHAKYLDEVEECYWKFRTQQDVEEDMDFLDGYFAKYQTYIPDEVETGYIPVGEVEEQHGIKIGKRCRSRNMLPLELNIKNSAEQRAREESRNQDRYR